MRDDIADYRAVQSRGSSIAQSDADRAVIARRKGNEARHIAAIAGTTEWARLYPRPDPNDGRLPEAAFDWPIYKAALAWNDGRHG